MLKDQTLELRITAILIIGLATSHIIIHTAQASILKTPNMGEDVAYRQKASFKQSQRTQQS